MPRLMGQDCRITLSAGGRLIKEIQAIKGVNFDIMGDAVPSDFLGEPGPDFDEVANGVSFKLDTEIDDEAYFDFLTRLIARKQGRDNFVVNLNARFNFRNGKRRIGTVPNCYFDNIPLEIPGRKEKVRSGLNGKAKIIQFPRGI